MGKNKKKGITNVVVIPCDHLKMDGTTVRKVSVIIVWRTENGPEHRAAHIFSVLWHGDHESANRLFSGAGAFLNPYPGVLGKYHEPEHQFEQICRRP